MTAYQLNKAVYELTRRSDRKALFESKQRFFEDFELSGAERNALLEPNFSTLRELGLLSNLLYRYYHLFGFDAGEFAGRLKEDAARRPQQPAGDVQTRG